MGPPHLQSPFRVLQTLGCLLRPIPESHPPCQGQLSSCTVMSRGVTSPSANCASAPWTWWLTSGAGSRLPGGLPQPPTPREDCGPHWSLLG